MSFFDGLEKYKDRACIVNQDTTFTYEETLRCAQKFISKIPSRSLVFLLGGNNYET